MIKVKNLSFTYSGNDNPAIDNVSLDIKKGHYTTIVGHNGSGKSTLSKLLIGLYKPQVGIINIDGIEINKKNLPQVRKKVGMVFQNPDNQFIGATVEDDIAFGLENQQMSREDMIKKIKEISNTINITDILKQEPQNLSGGQKQKVAIASIFAINPDIIILDEVTSMLDPKSKAEILKLIRHLNKTTKKTIISITHDMDEAIESDEVIVMSNAKSIAQGKPSEVLTNEKILNKAKLEHPFIFDITNQLSKIGIKKTHSEKEFIEALCK